MIDLELPHTPSAPVNNPTIARLKTAMMLFELAESMREEGILPQGIPTGWRDVQYWVEANGWGHPGGIPLDTLDKFNHRLQTLLDWADQWIPDGAQL